MPSLFAVFPVAIALVLRSRSRDDEIEAFAVGVFSGASFAFNVERFEFSSHVVSPKIVLRTHALKLRFGLELRVTPRNDETRKFRTSLCFYCELETVRYRGK